MWSPRARAVRGQRTDTTPGPSRGQDALGVSWRRVSLGLNPVSATLGCFAPLMLSALVCTEVTLMAAAMRGGDGGARGCKRPGAQCVCVHVCTRVHACARVSLRP